MKKSIKKLASLFLVITMMVTILPLGTVTIAEAAEDYQDAVLPVRNIYVTQKNGPGTYSHQDSYAVDFGLDQKVYAPFDCKVVFIGKGYDWGNSIVVQSLNKVRFANGIVDYMSLYVCHDPDISDLWVGKELKKGTHYYNTGKYGNATGIHIHLNVARGKYAGTRKTIQGYSEVKNSLQPADALFITADTKISYGGGYNWKREGVQKPAKPAINMSATGNVPVNTIANVSWGAVAHATGYKVYVNDSLVSTQTATTYSFKATTAQKYNVAVYAYNSKYTSDSSNVASFTAHKPCKVTFLDYNGNPITAQPVQVEYGSNAVAPEIPQREGYTFIGWDKSLNNITADTTITARYKINTYTVNFFDSDGNRLSSQKVNYGSSAVAPENLNIPTGYKFIGWNTDEYLKVKQDLNVYGIYDWGNRQLPIVLNITSAIRQEDGYYVYFDLTNYPDAITRGRAVVSLKTSEGKLVDTTESSAFSIPKNGTKKGVEVFVPCEEAASIMEVIVVNSYSSGVPISKSASKKIDQGLEWSAWSPTKPEGISFDEIESRTEYRYRDKETSKVTNTNSNYTMSGWILDSKSSAWGSYGNWSGWQTSAVTASDSRQVETRTVTDSAAYTQYQYMRYRKSGYSNIHWCPTLGKQYHGGTWVAEYTNWSTTKKPVYNSSAGRCSCHGSIIAYGTANNQYYWEYTKTVPAVTHKEYRYRDRSMMYTYNFYKWTNWSDWSASSVTANDSKQVETRTVYRWRNNSAGVEDTTGEYRTVSGTLSPDYAGKQATLFVYKVDEASDYSNEFVGQGTIAQDGRYSFTFKLREEPSAKTGDFTISLGVEGANNTMVIGTIKAPYPTHTVKFYDDGQLINEQTVEEGKSAELPDNPEKVGKIFVGWSASTTNVRGDIEAEARYIPIKQTVVFVDWLTQTVAVREFNYGDSLLTPELPLVDGYKFKAWVGEDYNGEETVTKNLVLTAEYEKNVYSVIFYDYDNQPISEQSVEHGESAVIPEGLQSEGKIFWGWTADSNFTEVTANIDVMAAFEYVEICPTPTASIKTGVYTSAKTVELTCDDEFAVIYYTLDGSDPSEVIAGDSENGPKLYEGPITIDSSCELRFVAGSINKANSPIVSEVYAISSETQKSGLLQYSEIPDYVMNNLVEFDLKSTTGYRYKDIASTDSIEEAEDYEANGWTQYDTTYGDWSNWTTSLPELNGLFVETRSKDPEPIQIPYYRYTHWKYYDSAKGVYVCTPAEVEGFEGEWETIELPSSLSITSFVGTSPAYSYNGENWFNQSIVAKDVVPDYTLYSYRTVTKHYFKWTQWTEDAPAIGETREYESDVLFYYSAPDVFLATIHDIELEEAKVVIVYSNQLIQLDETEYERDGYTLEGFYTDKTFTNKWDFNNDVVNASVELYPKYSKKSYSVTFKDYDGTVLSKQSVLFLDAAVAPTVPEREDYIFVGWGTDSYQCISEDSEFVAQYVHKNEYAKVEILGSDALSVCVGSQIKLAYNIIPADLSDADIAWSSSDEAVATVDEYGLVKCLKKGTAVITVTVLSTGETDTCKFIVTQNVAQSIVLGPQSYLFVDSLNYIRGLKVVTNTVEEVRSHFSNIDLKFFDINGNEMSDSDKVGTGTVVKLIDDGKVIDEQTFILTGDINGDGWYDGQDATIVTCLVDGMLTEEDIGRTAYLAADCNYDGAIDAFDIAILEKAGLLLSGIDQNQKDAQMVLAENGYIDLIDQTVDTADNAPDATVPETGPQTFIEYIILIITMIVEYIMSYMKNIF